MYALRAYISRTIVENFFEKKYRKNKNIQKTFFSKDNNREG